jgi:uncharacterized protein YdaU (DUF1376 family)
MAQPQWFPMYPTDFLTSTAMFTPQQGWAFTQLLLYAWTNGSIPDSREVCSRITRCDLTDEDWTVLRARFHLGPNGLVHPRMEREREKSIARIETAADAGRRGAARRWGGHSDPNGNPNGNPNGVPNATALAATTTPTPTTPHPTGGGAGGGEGISAKQGSKPTAVSPARGQGSTQARPKRSDGSTPQPTPSDAPKGISGDVVLRDPTPQEMGRITRWPGNRILPSEAVAAQQRGYIKGLREKGVGPDLIVAAWNRALTEWGERGINPYEFLRKTLLADWEGVRNADAVMRHRLGLKEQVA